jgi:hypothetical protein
MIDTTDPEWLDLSEAIVPTETHTFVAEVEGLLDDGSEGEMSCLVQWFVSGDRKVGPVVLPLAFVPEYMATLMDAVNSDKPGQEVATPEQPKNPGD